MKEEIRKRDREILKLSESGRGWRWRSTVFCSALRRAALALQNEDPDKAEDIIFDALNRASPAMAQPPEDWEM